VAELTKLREERGAQETMVQAIIEQRDMYRVLLSSSDSRLTTTASSSKSVAEEPAEENENSEKMIEIKSKLIVAEKTLSQLNNKLEKMEENDKLQSKLFETCRNDLSQFRSEASG
tara:strand:- start:173 stop:517 length:345 start_codon:yes stop_codon:yes gene_type:complete